MHRRLNYFRCTNGLLNRHSSSGSSSSSSSSSSSISLVYTLKCFNTCGDVIIIIIIIIIRIRIIIYLLNKAIEKKKCSNMNSRPGQQGRGTDSCPEIRELHYTKTTRQTKIKIQNNICNHINSK